MEATPALEGFGSPIIAASAGPEPSATTSPAHVGFSVAQHFEQYHRQRQLQARTAAVAPGPPSANPSADASPMPGLAYAPAVPGFRDTHHCCRLCSNLLPAASFYPSNLKRSAFYCKACSVARNRDHTARKRAPSNPDPAVQPESSHTPLEVLADRRPGQPNAALKMLNRLRRMCARPSECGFRAILSDAVSLNFDVKVAKDLLLWWNSTSAFATATEPAAATEDTTTDHELRFIPWRKEDTSSPLQPWEVIPVTRLQARRLTSTPAHLWAELLQPAAVAHVVAKTAELKRIILACRQTIPGDSA